MGAGKTTFLRQFPSELHIGNRTITVQKIEEPYELMRSSGSINLLSANYLELNPVFQLGFMFLLMRLRQSTLLSTTADVVIFERSPITAIEVYLRASEPKDDVIALTKTFLHEYQEDFVIFLDVDAETCHRRIMQRNRDNEHNIPLAYVEGLSALFRSWRQRSTNIQFLSENFFSIEHAIASFFVDEK